MQVAAWQAPGAPVTVRQALPSPSAVCVQPASESQASSVHELASSQAAGPVFRQAAPDSGRCQRVVEGGDDAARLVEREGAVAAAGAIAGPLDVAGLGRAERDGGVVGEVGGAGGAAVEAGRRGEDAAGGIAFAAELQRRSVGGGREAERREEEQAESGGRAGSLGMSGGGRRLKGCGERCALQPRIQERRESLGTRRWNE